MLRPATARRSTRGATVGVIAALLIAAAPACRRRPSRRRRTSCSCATASRSPTARRSCARPTAGDRPLPIIHGLASGCRAARARARARREGRRRDRQRSHRAADALDPTTDRRLRTSSRRRTPRSRRMSTSSRARSPTPRRLRSAPSPDTGEIAGRPLAPRDGIPVLRPGAPGLAGTRPARASASRSSTRASTAACRTSRRRDGSSRVVASVVTNPDATTHADTLRPRHACRGHHRRRRQPPRRRRLRSRQATSASPRAPNLDRDQGRRRRRRAAPSSTPSTASSSPSTTRTTTTSASSTSRCRRRTPSPTGPTRSTPRSSPRTSTASSSSPPPATAAPPPTPSTTRRERPVRAHRRRGRRPGTRQAREDDAFADWSSVGTTQDGFAKPEIGAPGAHIVSTLAHGQRLREPLPGLHRRRRLHPRSGARRWPRRSSPASRR